MSVGEFKGMKLVNIREYYIDKATGEERPGAKGIALTVDQWNALKDSVRSARCMALSSTIKTDIVYITLLIIFML